MTKSKRQRLIWVGFDGASLPFIEKFIAEGKLPTFARLKRDGVISESLPIPPCDTPTNWTVLQTGAHTGTTEVASFFTHQPGDPLNKGIHTLHSGAVHAESIWEAAERQGKRSIILNWPCSWPPKIKNGVQVGGTGPLTGSWRMGFGRVYWQGDLTSRPVDPVFVKNLGGFAEPIELVPMEGWTGTPASHRQPMVATFHLLGNQRMTWSDVGMQIEQEASDAPPAHVYRLLVIDSSGEGYDRALVTEGADSTEPVAVLEPGGWSPFISASFSRDRVIEQLLPIPTEQVEGIFRLKLLHLTPDAKTFALYRTDVWQADGWAYPDGLAAELRSAVGPFTEGLEMPPPPARVFDEWETYEEQLEEACEWYSDAATYLTREGDWDILAVQLHIQDGLNHILARDICEGEPEYDSTKAGVAWQQYERAYEASDRLVGKLIERCGDADTVVCVVSDHGGLPTFKQCLISGGLARAGLMTYARNGDTGRWDIDWSQSKVFPRRGQIWVNLRGRDPEGIVPLDQYEQVREQAIKAVLEIYDETSQTRPIVAALRKEDAVVFGQWGDKVGDIITFMAPGYADSEADYVSLPSDPLTSADIGPTDVACAHHPYLPSARYGFWSIPAVFMLAGPGVRKGFRRPQPLTQVDVAPTLSYLLGIAPPATCEGKIVSDVLEW